MGSAFVLLVALVAVEKLRVTVFALGVSDAWFTLDDWALGCIVIAGCEAITPVWMATVNAPKARYRFGVTATSFSNESHFPN
jgi:hypothetical protein